MKENKKLNSIFKDYLNKSIEAYCCVGMELLTKTKNNYELEILNSIRLNT